MRDTKQRPMIDHLECLQLQSSVHIKVPEGILALLDRLDLSLQVATVTNQPTLDTINILGVDVNKLLEQRSLLPKRPSHNPTSTQSTTTHTQLGPSSEKLHTSAFRAEAYMETIQLLF